MLLEALEEWGVKLYNPISLFCIKKKNLKKPPPFFMLVIEKPIFRGGGRFI